MNESWYTDHCDHEMRKQAYESWKAVAAETSKVCLLGILGETPLHQVCGCVGMWVCGCVCAGCVCACRHRCACVLVYECVCVWVCGCVDVQWYVVF